MPVLSPDEVGILALSLRVAVVSVICSLPIAILVAYGLARLSFPGKTLVDAIVHLPLVLPPVVVGFALLVLFGKRGPIGSLLDEWFGIVFAFRWTGAALASALMGFPLMVRAIRLSIEAVDQRLEVAARTLGGSRMWVFASITLPLALPGIITGTLLSFARGLGEFGATITFVSNIPGETQTLPLAIYTFTQVPGGDAQALRLSIVAVVLSIVALATSNGSRGALRDRKAMIDVDIEQQLGAFHLAATFSVNAPIVGLFGRSGAGKTSVINAIAGIGKPRRGLIRINDAVLFDSAHGIDLPPEERRIGYVFQDALLFPHLDVEANLLYGQRLRPLSDRFIEEGRVVELLGLSALLRRKPRTCPAEKNNGSPSAGPCLHNRAFCSWTSRSPRSTCRAGPRSSTISNACAISSTFRSCMSAIRCPKSRGLPTRWWYFRTESALPSATSRK